MCMETIQIEWSIRYFVRCLTHSNKVDYFLNGTNNAANVTTLLSCGQSAMCKNKIKTGNSTHRELGSARIFYWTTSLGTAVRSTAFRLRLVVADLNTACDLCKWWTRTTEYKAETGDGQTHVYRTRTLFSINKHCSGGRADNPYHLKWLSSLSLLKTSLR